MGYDVGAVAPIIERSLKQARQQADRALERRILLMWAYFIGYSESLDVVEARISAALELLANHDDPKWEMNIRLRAYHVALARGNLERAQAHIDAFKAASRRMRSLHQVKLSLLMSFEFAFVQGAWDRARVASDEALQMESRTVLDWQMPALRARLELELGNAETARPYLDRCLAEAESASSVEHMLTVANSLTSIARLNGDRGILALARKAVAPFAPPVLEEPRPRMPLVVSSAVVILAVLAYLEGNQETARKLRPRVAERHDLWLPAFEPIKPRLLGLLDMTLGDTDSAVACLTDALQQYRAGGQKPAVAWTCSEVAEALLRRGRAADSRRADVFLREARETAVSLGMARLLERIELLGKKPAP
jgi:ATP/maltotriose-dependent transcriptional regulator MalT